ncbi:MAG: hypothetical protein JW849_07950 [Phycisphaerae bacterium]|nr:hypothetical protein [Phycisphaerae bacterium]
MSDRAYSYRSEILPEVVYPDHPDWVNLYNATWKMAFDNLEYPDTHILGFRFDAASNTIHWVVAEKNPHGLKNVRFNQKTLSCLCEGLDENTGKIKLSVETTGEITLAASRMGRSGEETFSLHRGTHQLFV